MKLFWPLLLCSFCISCSVHEKLEECEVLFMLQKVYVTGIERDVRVYGQVPPNCADTAVKVIFSDVICLFSLDAFNFVKPQAIYFLLFM